MASCPAHFRTHWECCSWDWKKLKKIPAWGSTPTHTYLKAKILTTQLRALQTGRQQRGQKGQGYAEPLTSTTSQSTGGHPLPNLLRILWIAGSVSFRHLLETSLRWYGWTSEILPSNKQSNIQLSNLHKTKTNSLVFEFLTSSYRQEPQPIKRSTKILWLSFISVLVFTTI